MNILKAIWAFINGKKASIVAILGLTITLLLTKGIIDNVIAEYLSSILLILAGTANVVNYYKK